MEIIADLHLHSKYSRAVSPQMTIANMAKWAKIKGIGLLGTGDFTHPQWLGEIKESLEEKNGILELGGDKGKMGERGENTKFLLTAEISSIYKQGGKCRKIHNIVIAPTISAVEKINSELKEKGCNLSSDGRPIIGLSSENLAELVFSADNNCLIIPAHIWTPWFSLFGEKSGFDSVEECFGEYAKYIYAVETGLSSDPQMNWQVADLDNRSIVSFSDAHSLGKLGREATVLEINKLTYENIVGVLRGVGGVGEKIKYTIEFYPEEGKYHYSGHRNCGIVWPPEQTAEKGLTCPVCGKPLTMGVAERVEKLGESGRLGKLGKEKFDDFGVKWNSGENRPPFVRLVPLIEIIAETLNVGVSSQKVEKEYEKLTEKLGSELEILMVRDIGEIRKIGGQKLAEGISKVRSGDIFIEPGFDGVFGVVKVWPDSKKEERDGENKGKKEQMGLF